ncbi:MAG: hypothetical protein V3U60_01170 [Gammaproteobacteria bacterium]
MAENSGKLDTALGYLKLIKQLPDPYDWANSFRDSYTKHQNVSEVKRFAKGCRELNAALLELRENPSYFLSRIHNEKALDKLTNEELRDPAILEMIAAQTEEFRPVFDRVLSALEDVKELAYLRMGEVIVQLREGLEGRRHLLDQLVKLSSRPQQPEEIRAIAGAYRTLIDDIEPVREEIRLFVNEYT